MELVVSMALTDASSPTDIFSLKLSHVAEIKTRNLSPGIPLKLLYIVYQRATRILSRYSPITVLIMQEPSLFLIG